MSSTQNEAIETFGGLVKVVLVLYTYIHVEKHEQTR